MDAQPPGDDIAVRHHQSRRRYRQRPKTQLIQMQKIGTRVANDGAQIILGRVEVLLPFLHPVETKRGGMVFKPMQPIHPGGLMGKRNFSKADERNLRPMGHQTRNQFARVCPNSAECVGRNQYTHRTLGGSRAGNTLGLLSSSLGERPCRGKSFLGHSASPSRPWAGSRRAEEVENSAGRDSPGCTGNPIQFVILSGAGTSRSEVPAESKDPMLIALSKDASGISPHSSDTALAPLFLVC